MKTKLLLFFFLFLLVSNCFGQITFQRVITTQVACAANAVEQTTDGGYIIAGYTDSANFNQYAYLVKTNPNGDITWTKIFQGLIDYVANSVQQTTDGGYIVAGTSDNTGSFNRDIFVIKTNSSGDTLWTKSYGGINDEYGYFIQQTNDSGYIIAGQTSSFGVGSVNVYLLKINANGDVAWTKTYGGNDYDFGYCVRQTSDSGYIIVGTTYSFGNGSEGVYLIKTKTNGDTLWTKTYGGTDDYEGYSVQQSRDGGYIIAGHTHTFGAGSDDVYLIKTSANGDTAWTKTYGGANDDYANGVQQTTDSGYIISGTTNSFGAGNGDAYLIKTNSTGDTLWTKTYGGIGIEDYFSVCQTSDEGYIIAGTGSIGSTNGGDVYLIKTDANGNSGCYQGSTNTIVGSPATQVGSTNTIVGNGGVASSNAMIISSGGNDSTLCLSVGVHEQTLNHIITIYPNPTTDQLTITGNWQASKTLQLSVFNILGNRMLAQYINSKQSTVNCKHFTSGIYFITVADEKEQWVGRFVKE